MTEHTGALTHVKRLSWQSKLNEAKPIIIFLLASFITGMLLGALLTPFSLNPNSSFLLICFLGGFALTASVIFSARFIDRKFFGAVKSGILAVENRIIAGDARTQMEDLEKLVAGYLKLKRLEAADFYSRKLLELSKTGGTGIMKLSDWVVTSECWVSREDYHKSWNYKLVWLFETRGILSLSPDRIDFQSRKMNFSCSPANVVSLEIQRHPLWLKPVPFRYIKIVIDEMGQRHTFYLTPSFAQTDTVFDCNKLVDVWYERLKTITNKMSPAGAFPDWLKEIQG